MCAGLSVGNSGPQPGLNSHTVSGHVQPRCDNSNGAAVRLCGIIHGAEDNIDLLARQILNIAGRIACVSQCNITGYIDDDMGRSGDRGLQKRTLHGHFHGLKSFVISLAVTDADMCDTLVLHDSLNVRKVKVDNGRHIDQVGNSLNGLLKYLIRFLKRLRHGSTPVHNFKKLIVRNHDQRVHVFLNALNSVEGIHHARLGLKAERLGHHAHGQNPHLLGQLCNYGRSAGSRAASHSAGDKYHIRPLDGGSDLLRALLGGLLSHLGLCSGSQTLCQLFPDLEKLGRLTELQRLFIGIDTNKVHSVNLFVYHSINSIITCTAHADHNDLGCRFSVICLNLKQGYILLLPY